MTGRAGGRGRKDARGPAIVTEGLTKVYPGGVELWALRGVSLRVEQGEFLVVMGPSGSGKSTLLNLIGALDFPTQGRIAVGGLEVSGLSEDALADFRRQMIGFVFQLFNLIPEVTALENVMMPLLPHRRTLPFDLEERARELLDAVRMRHRSDHLPGQLSGGEQQRVAIARALVNDPPVILADEPTGNLDTRASDEVMELFSAVWGGGKRTVLVVTHNPRIGAIGKRVIFLKDGSLADEVWTSEKGDLDSLLSRLGMGR